MSEDQAGTYFETSVAPMMTYRQWLAGLAMQSLFGRAVLDGHGEDEVAHDAVRMADALIAELEKGEGK